MGLRKKKEKEEFIDDGRTIADMNVDGMPWSMKSSPDAPRTTGPQQPPEQQQKKQPYQMTREEGRTYTWAAIKAGILVALVFGLVFFFLILFIDKLWFRN